jgi:tetratricopeptide (TPR) repeat protein
MKRVSPSREMTIFEAQLEVMAGNWDRALTLFEDIDKKGDLTAYDRGELQNFKGWVYGLSNQVDLMEACYDSARVVLEGVVLEDPEDEWTHAELGLSYAGLGRKEEAIREGRAAVRLVPIDENAMRGAAMELNLACIYTMTGEYDQAIEKLDYLLSVPSEASVPRLRVEPDFAPMRELAAFRELLEKYAKQHHIQE